MRKLTFKTKLIAAIILYALFANIAPALNILLIPVIVISVYKHSIERIEVKSVTKMTP